MEKLVACNEKDTLNAILDEYNEIIGEKMV